MLVARTLTVGGKVGALALGWQNGSRMFNITRNRQSAVDKGVQKALDPKKDFQARIKHLKELLGLPYSAELFERLHEHKDAFVDCFFNAFRATDVWHKSQKCELLTAAKNVFAEYEVLLSVLEKLFAAMPDAFRTNKWQQAELIAVFKKLLHPATSSRIRQDSIRCFLLYYCIAGHDAGDDIHRLFRNIIPARNYSGTNNTVQSSATIDAQFHSFADHTQRWPMPSSVASTASSKSAASSAIMDGRFAVNRGGAQVPISSFFDGITPIFVPHQNEKSLHIRQQNAFEALLLELLKTTNVHRSLHFTASDQQQPTKPAVDGFTVSGSVLSGAQQLPGENTTNNRDTSTVDAPTGSNTKAGSLDSLRLKQQINSNASPHWRTGIAAFQFLYDKFKRVYVTRVVPATFRFIPSSPSPSTSTSPKPPAAEFVCDSSAILSSFRATPSSSTAPSSPLLTPHVTGLFQHDSFENLINAWPANEDEDRFPIMSAMLAQFLCSLLLKTSQPLELNTTTSLPGSTNFVLNIAGTRSDADRRPFSAAGGEALDTITTNFSSLTHRFRFDDGTIDTTHLRNCAAVVIADEDDQMVVHSVMRHALRHASTALGMRSDPSFSSSLPPTLSPAHAACLLALIIELYKMWLTNKKSVALARDISASSDGIKETTARHTTTVSSPEEFAFVQSLLQIFYNSASVVFLTPLTPKHSGMATSPQSPGNGSASPKRASTGGVNVISNGHETSSSTSLAALKVSRTGIPGESALAGDLQQRFRYYSDHLQVWQRLLDTFRMPIMHMDMSLKTWNIILTTLLKVVQFTMPTVGERRAANLLASRHSPASVSGGAATAPHITQWWQLCATSGNSGPFADSMQLMWAEKIVFFDAVAKNLLQALMVAYVKGAIHVPIRPELWDQLKMVLSGDKARHSPDVVEQWARIMVTLTRVLCREIYGVSLSSAEPGAVVSVGMPHSNSSRIPRGDKRPPLTTVISSDVTSGSELSPANSSIEKSLRTRPVRFSDPPLHISNFQKQLEEKSDDQFGVTTIRSAFYAGRQDLLCGSDVAVSSSEDEQDSTASSFSIPTSSAVAVKSRRWSSAPNALPDNVDCSQSASLLDSDQLVPFNGPVPLALPNSIAPPDADDVVAVEMGSSCLSLVVAVASLASTTGESHIPSPFAAEDELCSGEAMPDNVKPNRAAAQSITASTSDSSSGIEQVQQRLHVMAGGTIRGWTPEAVCVIWHRMLGILGNLSETASTSSFMPEATLSTATTVERVASLSDLRSSSISGSSDSFSSNKTGTVNNGMPPEHHELIMRSLDNFAQYLMHATDELQKQRMLKQQHQHKMQSNVDTAGAPALSSKRVKEAENDVVRDDVTTPTADGGVFGEENDEHVVDIAGVSDHAVVEGSRSDTEFGLVTVGSHAATASSPQRPNTAGVSSTVVSGEETGLSNATAAACVSKTSLPAFSSSAMCPADLASLRALPPSYAIAALVIEVLEKLDSHPAYIKSIVICYKLLGQVLFGNGGASGDVPGAQYLAHFYRIVHRALTVVGRDGNASSSANSPLGIVVASMYQQQAVILETVLLQCVLKLLRFTPPQAGILIDDILYGCERLLSLTRQLLASTPSQLQQRADVVRVSEHRTTLVLNVVAAVSEFLQRVDVRRQRVFQPSSGKSLRLVPLRAAATEERMARLLAQVCVPDCNNDSNDGDVTDHAVDFAVPSSSAALGGVVKRPAVLALPLPSYSLPTRISALYLCGVQLLRLLTRLMDSVGGSSSKLEASRDTTMHKIDMLLGCVLCCLSDINSEICNAAVDTLNLIAWQFLPASIVKASLSAVVEEKAFRSRTKPFPVEKLWSRCTGSSDESDDDTDADGLNDVYNFVAVCVRSVLLCLCRNIQQLANLCLSADFYAVHGRHQRTTTAGTVSKTCSADASTLSADSTLKPNQQLNEKKTSAALGSSVRFSTADECRSTTTTAEDGDTIPCVLLWRLVPMCFSLIDWVVQMPLPFLSQDWSQRMQYSGSSKYTMKSTGGTLKATTATTTAPSAATSGTSGGGDSEGVLLREIEATFLALTLAEHKMSTGGHSSAAGTTVPATPSSNETTTLKRQFADPRDDAAPWSNIINESNNGSQTAGLTTSSSRPSTSTASSTSTDQRRGRRYAADGSGSGMDDDAGVLESAEFTACNNNTTESSNTGYFARRRATKKAAAAAATPSSPCVENYSDTAVGTTASRRLTAPASSAAAPSVGNYRNPTVITKPTSYIRKHSRRSGGFSRKGNQPVVNQLQPAMAASTTSLRKKSNCDAADGATPLNITTTFARHSPRLQSELDKARRGALFTFQRPVLTTPTPATMSAAIKIKAAPPSSRFAATSKSSPHSTDQSSPAVAAAANVATSRIIRLLGNYAFRYTLSWMNCDVNVDSLSCPGSDFTEADVPDLSTGGMPKHTSKRRTSNVRDEYSEDTGGTASNVADEFDYSLLLASPNTQWFTIHEVVFSVTATRASESEPCGKRGAAGVGLDKKVVPSSTLEQQLLIPHGVTLHVFARDLAGRQYWTLRPVYGFRAFVKQLEQRMDALNAQEQPLERLAQHHKQLYEGWRHRVMIQEKQVDADVRQNVYIKLEDVIGVPSTFADDEDDVDSQRHRDKFAEVVELINRKCPDVGVLVGRTLTGASSETEKSIPSHSSVYFSEELEDSLMKMLQRQRDRIEECAVVDEFDELATAPVRLPPRPRWAEEAWLYACQFLSQFGYLGDRKRRLFRPLAKSAELVRDLRFLDKRNVRDFHKIGVVYVGAWQENKSSVMQNERGSALFNWFLEQIGWRVELEAHRGYMGGFPKSHALSTTNGSAPYSSVYFAAPSVEVMMHVNTLIPLGGHQPSGQQHDYTSRMRHIGNDAVIIVWSENWRDYDRNTIRTNFADVIICIYPLADVGLFRVSVIKKPGVPSFGPLQPSSEGSGEAELRLIDAGVLVPLVRATAINAGRAIRAAMPNWQWFFEERAVYLSNVISKHTSVDTPASLMRTLLGLSYAESNSASTMPASGCDTSASAECTNSAGNLPKSVDGRKHPRQLSITRIVEQLRAHGPSSRGSGYAAHDGISGDSAPAVVCYQQYTSSRATLDESSFVSSVTRGRSRSEGEVQTPPGTLTATASPAAAAAAVPSSTALSATTATSSYLRELLHSKRRQQPPTAVVSHRPLQESLEEVSIAPLSVRRGVPAASSAVGPLSDGRPWLTGFGFVGGFSLPSSANAVVFGNHIQLEHRIMQTAARDVTRAKPAVALLLPAVESDASSESAAEVDDGGNAKNEYGFDSMYDYPAGTDELQHDPDVPVIARLMSCKSSPLRATTNRNRKNIATKRQQIPHATATTELSDSTSFSSASSSPAPPPF